MERAAAPERPATPPALHAFVCSERGKGASFQSCNATCRRGLVGSRHRLHIAAGMVSFVVDDGSGMGGGQMGEAQLLRQSGHISQLVACRWPRCMIYWPLGVESLLTWIAG